MADIDVSKLSITTIEQITAFNNAKELEFIMDEIQEGSISNTQDKADITGKGGRKIGSLKRNKSVTVSATNGLLVGGALAAQTGTAVEQGEFTVRLSETVTVSSNKAVLTGEPAGTTGNEIGYVVPARLHQNQLPKIVEMYFRVRKPIKKGTIVIKCGDEVIRSIPKENLVPSEMEIIPVVTDLILEKKQDVTISMEDVVYA